MNQILTELQYEDYIVEQLVEKNGYVARTNLDFDRLFALDRELLFKFLEDTQGEILTKLKRIYKDEYQDIIIGKLNNDIISKSLIYVLKHGISISNETLHFMFTKPATDFNKTANENYRKNIFSVAKEVYAKDGERIDLVLFLNGIAIISFELKCNAAGQNYENAIYQFRNERDPKSRLFLYKAGCLVNFAMDLEEVYMTTKLDRERTHFFPFNKGKGEGINSGKGNPLNEDGFGVSYMWEDILTKDSLLEIISKFVFIDKKEKTDKVTGKKKKTETLIFPRYHQLDFIRKTLGDVRENGTTQNYLVQHSAGSGKTYTIAWLAHRLVSLHDEDNKVIFDNIVIITDRVVVDRQLQRAVSAIEHKAGLIKVLDDTCTSADLKDALEGNTKIIATTIQKFLYIADIAKGLKNKRFAVIIDEAHSSTAGKDMAAVTRTLGADVETDEEYDAEDLIRDTIQSHGKQPNVSMFAFTATPKATTLELFGRLNKKGQKEAFHLYSMKQAIEEGFILDVLQNFTPYTTYYKINKNIENDPKYKSKAAKKKIVRFAMLHETNIAQRIEIIVEHFRNQIAHLLDGQAKAMIVTGSRPEAVKYYQALIEYTQKKGYTDIRPLVAFSGKISEKKLGISDDPDRFVTETSLNGFSDDFTAEKFDEDGYRILLVANKYQTGFDQAKLCAMYVLKTLRGITAVQTLSRLNRICPPYDKTTFILDFVNDYEDMVKSFEPYYTTTLLCNSVTPELVYEIDAKIDSYYVFSFEDVESANKYFYDTELPPHKREQKITYFLSKAKKAYDAMDEIKQGEFYTALRHFVRYYEFLIQVSSFEDVDLHKKYSFITWLQPYLKKGKPGEGFDLTGKIKASDFYQKKGEEVKGTKMTPSPVVKLPTAQTFSLTEDEEKRLSDIIAELNSRTGKTFDNDVAIKAALQIKALMLKNPDLVASAKSNTLQDFNFSYLASIDDALVEGLSQNQEFFTMLLNNESIKKDVLGIFLKEIYDSLRDKKD